ncbi:MAG: oligosaccharide repeat unit polymerase [Oscillibacter sp.]|nr:oligosaccharide repeat unit polymerase [Oscillibacter sp.]
MLYAVFFSIIRGSRNDLMYILGAYMFIFIFYVYKHSSSRKKALKKAFRFLLIFAVGIVVMWGLSGIFFSRVGDSAVSSAIGYIGGPLAALNHLLQHSEIIDSAYFGQNTFNAVYQVLSGLEMLSFKPASVYLPYSGNFIFKTNVYSMYGRYFSDFGVLGCIILTSIFGCFYGFIYGVICRIRKEKIAHRLILIYAACMYGLLMSFFEDTFYRTLPNTIYILLFVLAVDYLLFSGGHRLSLSWNRNH